MGKKYKSIDALTSLKKPESINKCNKSVFDIETINWTEPYAVGLYYLKKDKKIYQQFKGKNCVLEFIEYFLTKKFRGNVCYAHNGGKFDFSFILKELFQAKYQEKFIIEPMRAASRIIQISIKSYSEVETKDNGKTKEIEHCWTLRDSMCLFPFSLKQVSLNFDVEHKKGDFDHSKINWKNWESLEPEWSPYLKDDCRSLYESLEKFEDYLIDKFSINLKKNITLAQLALRVYRTNFLDYPISCYRAIEDDIRKSYFGGRTEIFKVYGENLKYFDVTSLYPTVMHDKWMPVGKPIKDVGMKVSDFGVLKVTVTAPNDINIPLLPVKSKSGKLIFPRGTWTGFYCSPELQKAEKLGYKIKVHFGYRFKCAKIFTGYVDELFKLKTNSKKGSVDYLVAKLLLNSLYGKFGQRRERQQMVIFPKSTIGLEPIDFFGDLPVFTKKTESRSKHILPAIASFVTSYARLYLYEKCFEAAQKKGGNIYYCDTDSVVTDVDLDIGNKLGDLTDELPKGKGSGIKEGIFLLPKMYGIKLNVPITHTDAAGNVTETKDFIKCKGFPKKIFDYNIYKQAYLTNDYTDFKYKKTQIATPFESMRRNKTFVSMLEKSRTVQQRYDKRIVLPDGINTIPHTIEEIEENTI